MTDDYEYDDEQELLGPLMPDDLPDFELYSYSIMNPSDISATK